MARCTALSCLQAIRGGIGIRLVAHSRTRAGVWMRDETFDDYRRCVGEIGTHEGIPPGVYMLVSRRGASDRILSKRSLMTVSTFDHQGQSRKLCRIMS